MWRFGQECRVVAEKPAGRGQRGVQDIDGALESEGNYEEKDYSYR